MCRGIINGNFVSVIAWSLLHDNIVILFLQKYKPQCASSNRISKTGTGQQRRVPYSLRLKRDVRSIKIRLLFECKPSISNKLQDNKLPLDNI